MVSRRPNLLLHIGMPKAASTTLQYAFYEGGGGWDTDSNEKKCLAHLPVDSNIFKRPNHALELYKALDVKKSDTLDTIYPRIANWCQIVLSNVRISNSGTFIVSHEQLHRFSCPKKP